MAAQKKSGGFVATTYEIMNAGYDEAGWSDDGKSVVVRNPEKFALEILPVHFGHAQFASWVRAANAHGFKKMGRGVWMHPSFQRECMLLRSTPSEPRPCFLSSHIFTHAQISARVHLPTQAA